MASTSVFIDERKKRMANVRQQNSRDGADEKRRRHAGESNTKVPVYR